MSQCIVSAPEASHGNEFHQLIMIGWKKYFLLYALKEYLPDDFIKHPLAFALRATAAIPPAVGHVADLSQPWVLPFLG